MRKILAATLVATAAFTVAPAPASAGCVEDYILTGDDQEFPTIVERNPDGSITIYPPPTTVSLLPIVAHVVDFVNCVV